MDFYDFVGFGYFFIIIYKQKSSFQKEERFFLRNIYLYNTLCIDKLGNKKEYPVMTIALSNPSIQDSESWVLIGEIDGHSDLSNVFTSTLVMGEDVDEKFFTLTAANDFKNKNGESKNTEFLAEFNAQPEKNTYQFNSNVKLNDRNVYG